MALRERRPSGCINYCCLSNRPATVPPGKTHCGGSRYPHLLEHNQRGQWLRRLHFEIPAPELNYPVIQIRSAKHPGATSKHIPSSPHDKKSPHSGHKLSRRKWFQNIVIRAQFKTTHNIRFFTHGRQDYNWNLAVR